jgi:hypothetical protein
MKVFDELQYRIIKREIENLTWLDNIDKENIIFTINESRKVYDNNRMEKDFDV